MDNELVPIYVQQETLRLLGLAERALGLELDVTVDLAVGLLLRVVLVMRSHGAVAVDVRAGELVLARIREAGATGFMEFPRGVGDA